MRNTRLANGFHRQKGREKAVRYILKQWVRVAVVLLIWKEPADTRPASSEQINLNAPHRPTAKAIEAFNVVLHQIKSEIVKSRHHWDKHEPKMWARAAGLSDAELVNFTMEEDLVECRSAPTSYGTVILGKIRIPAVNDEEGEGFIHVRYVDYASELDGKVLTRGRMRI